MEATGMNPGDVARLRLPRIMWDSDIAHYRCLQFQYSMRGRHVGRLEVRNNNDALMWQRVASELAVTTVTCTPICGV